MGLANILAHRRLNELNRKWIAYRDLIQRYEGSPDATEEQERALLELEGNIARLLASLTDSVPGDASQDARSQAAGMRDLLTRHRMLSGPPVPPAVRDAFLRAWHAHYLFLNQMKGIPLDQRRRPDGPARRPSPISGLPRIPRGRSPLPSLVGWVLRLGLFALVVFLLARALGFGQGEDGRLKAEVPSGAGEVGSRLASALASLISAGTRFMQPVTAAYGVEVTIILVGILVLALAYWGFVRTR